MTDPESQRRSEYSKCAVQLQDDHEAAGAEGLYDQALTNGLAAIVAQEWPGEEQWGPSRIKSADALLSVIEEEAQEVTPGVYALTFSDWGGEQVEVLMAAGVLRQGITGTQPIRHARPSAGTRIQQIHVEALVALDRHPALQSLHFAQADELWRQERQEDRRRVGQALTYIALLQESLDEWERRLGDRYVEQFLPGRPEESDSRGPQECPVCSVQSLIISGIDDFGIGLGAGTCCVCGYSRSEYLANDEAELIHIEHVD